MRALFILQYPGHLRYYDSVLLELARRGHHVLLAFDQPNKQPEGLRALDTVDGTIELVGELPARTDSWASFARGLRGTLDYLKYLHPDFAHLDYLRRRWEKFLPGPARPLRHVPQISPWLFRFLSLALRRLERAIPTSHHFDGWVAALRPNVVVASPYITTFWQSDAVKSAKGLGIPTVYGVASWDNLTTKGQVRVVPDAVLVWNEEMREEAARYHLLDRKLVYVTGAQPYDRWFARRPSTSREQFLKKVGLPPDAQYVMFVGSTASISAPEAERGFVHRWIEELRREPSLSGMSVLIRPHPYNSAHWTPTDVADLPASVIWPPWGANPVDEEDRADYYDSMAHSAAVVGVNTSAMIESAIVGKPVFSIRDPRFTDTQDGTLHFRYLLRENGGFVETAESIEEHVRQLAATLSDPEAAQAHASRFVERFVRPGGIDRPRTPEIADVIERLGARKRRRTAPAAGDLIVRAAITPLAAAAAAVWLAEQRAAQIVARLPRPLRERARAAQAKRIARRRGDVALAPPAQAPGRDEVAA